MSYEAEISRTNPSLVIFLIDQSRSMSHKIAGGENSKAKEAADAINRQIGEFIGRCTKSDGIRDYFYISVIGYGFKAGMARPLLSGDPIQPISELANHPLRTEKRVMKVSDGEGGLIDVDYELGIWFDPVAASDTPMVKALTISRDLVREWVENHRDSYPPIVINISDGQATDGDPIQIAEEIKQLATSDGETLLWNCHLSSTPGTPITFPSSEAMLPDDKYARSLFQMSSPLPEQYMGYAREMSFDLKDGARSYVYNAQLEQLIQFIDIGTRGPAGQIL